MTFVSVTRLRMRSARYLPLFFWKALRTARQAEGAHQAFSAAGCLSRQKKSFGR